ncbi:VIT family protein [Fructobacillus sp. M1-13]|uniref:VIT family protein n=1 Tax=Fructobacillus papyriferae TaxID=2713171 RepID=A0ABS5QPQ7_9LACO|nr:VIT family protein [Fructobacillus papyriferae]MBS9335085.1 VIT family protein [Fructobacillus papyriferae]MCD2159429.1 VIT family protein [Fructobacillus papyriferae]
MEKQSLMAHNNLVRAGVMGGNDGILSVAGIIVGVASAGQSLAAIMLSGFAGTLAGMVSMAMGEFVSVRSSHDAQEKARMSQESALKDHYDEEFDFVKQKYQAAGISEELATQATEEMMTKDPLETTVRERHGFSLKSQVSAGGAALVSFVTFPTGAALPMAFMALAAPRLRVMATFLAVLIALLVTGYLAAVVNGANRTKGAIRNLLSGILTMVVTFLIGSLFK